MKCNKTFCFVGLFSACCVASAPVPQSKPAATLEELQQRLAEVVSQPRFAAGSLGVKVVSLESGKTLFEHEPGKLFSPASNSKLYTVALALDQFGGEYRIKTSLYASRQPDRQGVLQGDLIVYGRGDPTINARRNSGDIFEALQPLVSVLTNAGVRAVAGDLIGDESFFRGNPFGSGWDCEDLEYYYGAEISALTINDNVVQLSAKPAGREGEPCRLTVLPDTPYLVLSNRTETILAGGRRDISLHRPFGQNVVYVFGRLPLDDPGYVREVTMHNPAGLFILLFKEALVHNGVKVSGESRMLNWLDRQVAPFDPDKLVELGAVESPPMRELAREIQKPSQNLYTDLLLAHVGSVTLATNGSSTATSEDTGIRQLYAFLAKVGIRRGDAQFEEGSGLSRNNLTTPRATVALLQYMNSHGEAEAYLNALPVAGVDGTLRNRMKDTPAAGNVRAKTGTLRWANSLSGHVTTAAGERLVFSIMLNRYVAGTNPPARGEIDKIAVMLAEFAGRSE